MQSSVRKEIYHQAPQTKGLAAHKTIDNKTYTTSVKVLQAMEVYSDRYNIGGKIDLFDTRTGLLSERKKIIKTVYDGYIYQLFAQYFALTDMGYKVKALRLYSMDDNKAYPIAKPEDDPKHWRNFECLLIAIRSFNLNARFEPNPKKCQNCIYHNICDVAEDDPC